MNNSKGIPTNAVYGFCNMMLRLIDEHPHDKILIILDAGKNTFRNTLYSEYKANRSEAPEDLIPQFGIIREAIDAFGLDVIFLTIANITGNNIISLKIFFFNNI